jgi:hypothetical protein
MAQRDFALSSIVESADLPVLYWLVPEDGIYHLSFGKVYEAFAAFKLDFDE